MMFRSFFLCLSRGGGVCVSLCVGLSINGFDAVARCLELG